MGGVGISARFPERGWGEWSAQHSTAQVMVRGLRKVCPVVLSRPDWREQGFVMRTGAGGGESWKDHLGVIAGGLSSRLSPSDV